MTVEETLNNRASTHGFYPTQSSVAQNIKTAIRSGTGWETMPAPMCEALELIATKISRIVNGNPYHADSWHDIAGYATLIEDFITKGKPHD